MTRRLFAFVIVLCALALGIPVAPEAEAARSNWDRTDHTAVRLISAQPTTGTSDELILGLQFQLEPGWKIYWRSPGDAGFPPQPLWQGSENLKQAEIEWPVPERFSIFGLETLGYTDEVVLPLIVKLERPGEPVSLTTKVPYLVCDDICIPYTANLALELPAGATGEDGGKTAEAELISYFQGLVPDAGAATGITLKDKAALRTETISGGDKPKTQSTLTLLASAETPFERPDVFLEGADGLNFGKPEVALRDGGKTAVLNVPVTGVDFVTKQTGQGLGGSQLIATFVDGPRFLEASLVINEAPIDAPVIGQTAPEPVVLPSLWSILLLAVLGGVILNLMPCVLPVLSIKVLGLVSHGRGERSAVRKSFLASSAGIFAAFMLLAGALVALKASGAGIGWGIQFQQPWFLGALAAVVTLFAANLFGFFEIRLPGFATDLDARAAGHQGLSGHFLQGMLATVLATPCSAPFLGTAVGFALAAGALEIFSVFGGLAFGLALPYLLIAAYPKAATWLPKPGAWMIRLKQVLGAALLLTAAWLISVIQGAAGETATIIAAVSVVGLLAATALLKKKPGAMAAVAASLALIAVVGTDATATSRNADATQAIADARGTHWEPFDLAAIPGLVAEGKTVIVDVTADWCITCQVNKKAVLDQDTIQAWIAQDNVVAMIADWTRPDPAISAYLESFGRFGIPFNAIYGPAKPEGVVLPELLTEGAVTQGAAAAEGAARLAKNNTATD